MLAAAQVLHSGVNLLDKVDELKARSAATKQEMEVRPAADSCPNRLLQACLGRALHRMAASWDACAPEPRGPPGARGVPQVRRRQEEEQQRRLQQLQARQLDLSQAYSSLEVRSRLSRAAA